MSADTIVTQPHDDLGEDTFHEWWFEGRHLWLNKLGRPNGQTTPWITMRCNNPACEARAIVRERSVAAAFAPAGEAIAYATPEAGA